MASNTSLQDQQLQHKIKKLKYQLLKWEAKFEEKHGRKPRASDIKARASVEHVYKKYNRAKKELQRSLERTGDAYPPLDPASQVTIPASQASDEQHDGPVAHRPSVNAEHSHSRPLSPSKSKAANPSVFDANKVATTWSQPSASEFGGLQQDATEHTTENQKQPAASPSHSKHKHSLDRSASVLSDRDQEQTPTNQLPLDAKPSEPPTKHRRRLDRNDPIVRMRKAKFAAMLGQPLFRSKSSSGRLYSPKDAKQPSDNDVTPELKPRRDSDSRENVSPNNAPDRRLPSSTGSRHQLVASCGPVTDLDSEYLPNSPLTDRQRRLMQIPSSQPELSSSSYSQQTTDDEMSQQTDSPLTALQRKLNAHATSSDTTLSCEQDPLDLSDVLPTRISDTRIFQSTSDIVEMLKEGQEEEDLENEAFWLDISVQELQRRKWAGEPVLGLAQDKRDEKEARVWRG